MLHAGIIINLGQLWGDRMTSRSLLFIRSIASHPLLWKRRLQPAVTGSSSRHTSTSQSSPPERTFTDATGLDDGQAPAFGPKREQKNQRGDCGRLCPLKLVPACRWTTLCSFPAHVVSVTQRAPVSRLLLNGTARLVTRRGTGY